jgi:hypothetical protein
MFFKIFTYLPHILGYHRRVSKNVLIDPLKYVFFVAMPDLPSMVDQPGTEWMYFTLICLQTISG